MYVNLIRFKINDQEGIRSNDISLIEDNLSPLPQGLDRFHIFKDKEKTNRFYLIEYWESKEAMKAMETSDEFPLLNKIHRIGKIKPSKQRTFDVII